MAECEKIMCFDNACNNNAAEMMALMNNGNWNNNPFMYLILLAFMNGGLGWNNRGDFGQLNDLSRQIQSVQGSVNDNHNNGVALAAINGNRDAIAQLAQTLNTSTQNVQTAICGVKSAIENVAGKVGYSAEAVKNAIALGDANIIQQMQSCCCQQKELIQRMGYENQLQNCQNHGSLMSRIDQLANGVTQGFSAIGYENAKNTQEIINAGNQNTQRILDVMCANTTQQLRDQLAQKDRELMTASIVAQLKKECGCGC